MWRHLLVLCLGLLLTGVTAGCVGNTKEAESIYLALEGQSQTWTVEDYEVYLSDETLTSGQGTVKMKQETDDKTNFISVDVSMKMGDDNHSLGGTSIDGPTQHLATEGINTGTLTKEGPLLLENKQPVTPEDIDEIVATITWWDEEAGKDVEERIQLYKKDESLIMEKEPGDL